MADATAGSLNYFRWQPAPSAPAISISAEVMEGIESQVISGLKGLPRRGAEIGGALLGYRDPETGEFFVDRFRAIPIEYATGPSYVLSERDLENWRGEVAEIRSSSPGFIGIYRSQTRPGLCVDQNDCSVVEKLLPREKGVLLLVKPLSSEEAVGAFFLCDGGAVIDHAVNAREFPFAGQASRNATTEKRRNTKTGWWLLSSAVAAGIGMALFFHYRSGSAAEENPVESAAPIMAPDAHGAFGLRAEPDGSNARIGWDPASAPIGAATEATIDVADGNTHKTLRLTPGDLRTGYVEWRPQGAEATFSMRLAGPQGPLASDSVRFSNPAYPINSSSDSPYRKPAAAPLPSAPTGNEKRLVHRTVPKRSEVASALAPQTQKPGRVRRMFNSVTSKASHLWPFRSAKPERQTQ